MFHNSYSLTDKFFVLSRHLCMLFRGYLTGYKYLFRGNNVVLRSRSKISISQGVRLYDNVRIEAFGNGRVILEKKSKIGANSLVIATSSVGLGGGIIHLGKNVGIGEFAYLGGNGGITIGNDTIVGQYFSLHSENHIVSVGTLVRKNPVTNKGIKIGDNCWIGAKVTVLDGSSIGEGSIVAAGAVVRGKYPPRTLIGGVPARVIKYL